MTLPVGQSTVERDIAKVKVQSIHAGVVAPDFEAKTLDGKPFKLSELRGKVVFIDFWATWCGPCVAELPKVKKLYEEFGGDNFVVVGISFDKDAETAQKFASARELPWIQIWAEKADKGPIANLYGVGGIPAKFLIGPDGKVIERDLRGEALAAAVGRHVRNVSGSGPVAAASDDDEVEGPSGGGGSVLGGFLAGLLRAGGAVPGEPLPEESPEARAVLDATLAHYRALKSYRDSYCYEARLEQKGRPLEEGRIDGTLASADGRIAVKWDYTHAYSDGEEVKWYWPSRGRWSYTAPSMTTAEALGGAPWSLSREPVGGGHPLAAVLAGGEDGDEYLPIVVVTGVQPAEREGRAGRLLSGRFRLDRLEHGSMLPFEAFIDGERQLFEEFRLDYTEGYRAVLRQSYERDPEAVEKAEIVITLRDVETDAEIPDDTFVPNAPGTRVYDPYYWTCSDEIAQPDKLLGQRAPALIGTTFDGGRFDLAAEHGKVVVVAFWATWMPQAEPLLREMQRLAADSAANVCFVGVNGNGAAGEAIMRQTVERCGVRFPQISDAEHGIAEEWHVTCLPLVYVVDSAGQVKAVFPTWTEDVRTALADCVGKLAAGETITAASFDEDEGLGMAITAPDEPGGNARVNLEESMMFSGSRWNMSEQDVDGDGEVELIFPDYQGGVSILKPSTGVVQKLRLPGLEGADVQAVRGVPVDGEVCWLCTAARYTTFDGSRMRMLLCLYSPRGELLWKLEPTLGPGVQGQAEAVGGDFDGDGRVEYVVGLALYVREQVDESSFRSTETGGRLIWIDDDGQVIADRKLDDQVSLLYAVPAPPGERATVLCVNGSQMERYTLLPESSEGEEVVSPVP
ncbi:MAG: TlpA disulfide reductase family protein [Phycisphaerae bacterium]|jgi:peroxiredoxin